MLPVDDKNGDEKIQMTNDEPDGGNRTATERGSIRGTMASGSVWTLSAGRTRSAGGALQKSCRIRP